MKILLNTSAAEEQKEKKVPMYKDPVMIAKFKQEFIARHNERIRRQESKSAK